MVIGYYISNPGTLITLNCYPHLYNLGPKYIIPSINGIAVDVTVLTIITTHRITAVTGKINTLRLTYIIHV